MGIYRSLLEEEITHLDDNNDTNEQIEDLMDALDDHDANEAEQERAQAAEFEEPGTPAEELLGESWMAIYEFEQAHANLMQAIGVHEISEAAMGREVLWEAPDIKGFFTNIKNKIVEFFKKVWSVVQRWAGNLNALFSTNKRLLEKFGSKIDDGFKLKDKIKKQPKGYSFEGFDKIAVSKEDVAAKVEEVGKFAVSNLDKFENGTYEATTAEDVESALKTIRKSYGVDDASSSDFASKLKEKMYGSKEPSSMWMDPKTIKDVLADKKNYKSGIKKLMEGVKKQSKDAISKIDKMEKSVKSKMSKDSDNTNSNKLIMECNRYVEFHRGVLTATQVYRTQYLHAMNALCRQARKYAMVYIAAANKDKHKGFGESTDYGFIGRLNLV